MEPGVVYGDLTNRGYRPRLIEGQLVEALEIFGGACIEGPKYCGKTWTGRALASSEIALIESVGSPVARDVVMADPGLALSGESPRLIDEWQEMPQVWDMVRSAIDESGKERKFILTGSATPRARRPRHSGIGRIEKLRMRTMSLSESGESNCRVSLAALLEGQAPRCEAPRMGADDLALLAVRGGWPGTLGIGERAAGRLASSYVKAFLAEDMHKVDGQKRDPRKMERLMRSYARNVEQAATPKTLIRDMTGGGAGVPLAIETVDDYSAVLKSAFLLEQIEPWSPNLRSKYRISKKPKYHYVDPSIAAALLGATPKKLMADFETFGFLFEAMCMRDILVYAQSIRAQVYFYRDQEGLEADAIVEGEDGAWGAIEVKLGHSQEDAAAANLVKLRDRVVEAGARPPAFLAVVEGLGDWAYERQDGVAVVPICALTA